MVPYLIDEALQIPEQKIVWLCFDDFSPQQKSLQNFWEAQGKIQYFYELPEQSTQISYYPAQDNQDEYEQLMLWLKA